MPPAHSGIRHRHLTRMPRRPIDVTSLAEEMPMSVLDRLRLDGRRVFMTGGSRGLGREMALAMASVGADITVTGRNEDSLVAVAGEIEDLGRRATTIVADMADPDTCA